MTRSAPIKDAVTADGDVVVPIDTSAFGFWLKAAFGEPMTSGSSSWTHEFPLREPDAAVAVDRDGDARGAAVCDVLRLRPRPAQLAIAAFGVGSTATAKLVAQGETVGTTSAAGTSAQPALQRFGHFNGSITRNGTALGNVVSAEITYANNLDRIETIRSDGKIDGADPSIAALTGRVEVRFAGQVLVNQALAGDPCELEFAYAPPSGESFTFTVQTVTCRGRGSTLPARKACRRPSTGRRRGTTNSGGCAPPRSSTTSRRTYAWTAPRFRRGARLGPCSNPRKVAGAREGQEADRRSAEESGPSPHCHRKE